MASGIEEALRLSPRQVRSCLDVIERRDAELEELRTGIPRNRRLSPEQQRIFGSNAYLAGPEEFLRLVGESV